MNVPVRRVSSVRSLCSEKSVFVGSGRWSSGCVGAAKLSGFAELSSTCTTRLFGVSSSEKYALGE
jgi:hypothetical protein